MHPQSLAEEEIKTESDVLEGMEVSVPTKVPDPPGSAERVLVPQKRKVSSPTHSSNGHSPTDTSPSPVKKKKKPGAMSSHNKDQSELRHGPFYYAKQPALTTDPVDVVPQDGRNDFYCWLCHREGQVLCCELCPRVYHAKCLKLPAEPEGDWFCPECEKITVAECIETQSKAMTMLTIDQLSYLLKFALQKMKQPGTEPFHKPVALEQHPDYAEYIFHAMDLFTLEKVLNVKKKMYGCTEAFLADVKWILHNCIIYNGGNHKLTATAKVIVKICEHEMNEIEVCPECYLSSCQKRDNWFCEPCSPPHPLVWAKLKGFPFWPAKALREKDGQVDARFFGQHDRAWVPLNNCYLMSKEIPFSVKKTKSIFNSAMQEMEVYVENIRRKFGVFNYAPFRTPFTPNNQLQMLLDPSNPGAGTVKLEKPEKLRLNFDITISPKMLLGKSSAPSGMSRRISMTDMPRSPMSTNSSVHTGSDAEPDGNDKPPRNLPFHYSTGEESMDFSASPASSKIGPAGSATGSPKPFNPGLVPKQERTTGPGSILNLNLDRVKAEMDLKELSESVQQQQQQQQGAAVLPTPKRPIRSLDKTIESCKAQLGIDEISEDVYKGVEHSDSEDSDKSDSSDSEYPSDEEHKPKSSAHEDKEKAERRRPRSLGQGEGPEGGSDTGDKVTPDPLVTEKQGSNGQDRDPQDKPRAAGGQPPLDTTKAPEEGRSAALASSAEQDSDSERELVIDLGDENGGRDRKRPKKEPATSMAKLVKDPSAVKMEGKFPLSAVAASPAQEALNQKDSSQPPTMAAHSLVSAAASAQTTTAPVWSPPAPSPSSTSASTTSSTSTSVAAAPSAAKKQRPLLPKEAGQAVPRAVVWNPTSKFPTSFKKVHVQKVQSQQHQQPPQQPAEPAAVAAPAPVAAPLQAHSPSQSQQQNSSSSSRYQTRQSAKVKDPPHSTSTSSATPTTAGGASSTSSSSAASSSSSFLIGDLQIPTGSADVAADIAKYTSKMMDTIKGTMTEIYNDLSKSTSGNTIAEIRRLRIEIEKLQWLHQQELSEMKHNLELTMAEMRQSLEQERERLVAEVKKQTESEKQQAVDETKKKQWCANCRKEAIFYCCWNTSYCDYPCQQAHWPEHMKSCTQSGRPNSTAPQPEPETEPSSDPTAKPPPHPPATQTLPSAAGSIPDKNSSPRYLEKSKDSAAGVTVT
ncbi:MYND-type zinc finger-containing chromatin reader ZMYND8-like isoform X3 [Gadus macrocephalus]|uniref:MYND-type zinc finger-containing chromatin reader ZMYND8-like isoform X3 n=1 Tax=Gadus macrocephalus TaxID=80720 RepID=UPI0028CB857D|nr:MYND-type zinc finger-containing chromatin reader ZMYND8-like isoform X3 [Gadus macrocephalus]XP_059892894.1 MYND-type zinc finger-containing chromatin reader ZMYND8-like isoform X3 [Gadus macrocephalus]XP_059892978.1 MYND-type zinc finger-containing chromatin reader ZMYND8-like isoform X3 [Gadus macrocephalus]XP_059893057.1 MYND-type zinc finger-containing chromatin reader ZMYND8-like isoform X3 [Gadus macrocephalus]